jgi:hypothetical protein
MTNIELTADPDLQRDPQFQTIANAIQSLVDTGFVSNLGGNCVAAAEMVSMILHQNNVESAVIECQVSIKRTNEEGLPQFNFVGFNGMGIGPNSVDTHVVTVTKGPNPVLIDVSIWPSLPSDHPFVVEYVSKSGDNVIADFDYGEFRVTYTTKKDLRLPHLHQRSILDRMKAEETIKAKLNWVAYTALAALGVTILNSVMNGIIVYFRVIGEM